MAQLFKKDSRLWTKSQQEQAEYFFKCNRFFSQFYEDKHFEEIVEMVYYAKIQPTQPLFLAESKKPAVVVCLSGDIIICKKSSDLKQRKVKRFSHQSNEYVKFTQLIGFNQWTHVNADCKLESLHEETSQIVYVPYSLYSKYMESRKQEKNQSIFNVFNKFFPIYERKPIYELSVSGCSYQTYHINNVIYGAGEKPNYVYLLLEGSVKIESDQQNQMISGMRSTRSFLSIDGDRKVPNRVVVSAQALIGEKDLYFPQRESTVTSCSADLKLIQIPKEQF